jgi:hypothetical protein
MSKIIMDLLSYSKELGILGLVIVAIAMIVRSYLKHGKANSKQNTKFAYSMVSILIIMMIAVFIFDFMGKEASTSDKPLPENMKLKEQAGKPPDRGSLDRPKQKQESTFTLVIAGIEDKLYEGRWEIRIDGSHTQLIASPKIYLPVKLLDQGDNITYEIRNGKEVVKNGITTIDNGYGRILIE